MVAQAPTTAYNERLSDNRLGREPHGKYDYWKSMWTPHWHGTGSSRNAQPPKTPFWTASNVTSLALPQDLVNLENQRRRHDLLLVTETPHTLDLFDEQRLQSRQGMCRLVGGRQDHRGREAGDLRCHLQVLVWLRVPRGLNAILRPSLLIVIERLWVSRIRCTNVYW